MKIYRYNNRPAFLRGSYQHGVITGITAPFDHDEFNDHFADERNNDLRNWLFGFTKWQLISANLRSKDREECRRPWNKKSKLLSFDVPDEDILMLSDQVVFYAPSASLPIEQLK